VGVLRMVEQEAFRESASPDSLKEISHSAFPAPLW
jgi:hypothetical protein